MIGMLFSITNDAAMVFSERFYRTLAEGKSVPHALYLARGEMARADVFPWEFALPILHAAAPIAADAPTSIVSPAYSRIAAVSPSAVAL